MSSILTFITNGGSTGSNPVPTTMARSEVRRAIEITVPHMLDSSNWSGGPPLTRTIAGSSPLSSTTTQKQGGNSHEFYQRSYRFAI